MTHSQTLQALSAPSSLNLDRLNQQFDQAHPKAILLWCLENLSEGMIQATAFGLSGMVILDLLYRDLDPKPPVPVVFLDTLHHFAETLDLVRHAQERYGLDLKIYRPNGVNSREDFTARYGQQLWTSDVGQ